MTLHREADAWNTLQEEANTIVMFNRDLYRHMNRQGTEGYGSCTGRWIELDWHRGLLRSGRTEDLFLCCTGMGLITILELPLNEWNAPGSKEQGGGKTDRISAE